MSPPVGKAKKHTPCRTAKNCAYWKEEHPCPSERKPVRSIIRPRNCPILWPVNATELLNQLVGRGLGAETSPRGEASRAVTFEGIEIGLSSRADENGLRRRWKNRVETTGLRYLLLADDPSHPNSVLALGPRTEEAPLRSLKSRALFGLLETMVKFQYGEDGGHPLVDGGNGPTGSERDRRR